MFPSDAAAQWVLAPTPAVDVYVPLRPFGPTLATPNGGCLLVDSASTGGPVHHWTRRLGPIALSVAVQRWGIAFTIKRWSVR